MKKRIPLLIGLVMLLSVSACASGDSSAVSPPASDTSSAAQSAADESSSTAEAPKKAVHMLDRKPKQVINETPASYEAFGIDAAAKQEFITKHTTGKGMPVVSISTKDNEYILSREEYTSCVVDVFNCDDKYVLSNVSAGIKVRGNSSAYYGNESDIMKNSVPYRIKFDQKTNVLGLNGGAECKSWVLHKCDWDVIRNDLALRMGRAIIGDRTFCSDGQLVRVYVNDKFQDLYLLCEQCQVNPNRVDITEPEPDCTDNDIGYYLEIDNYADSEPNAVFFDMEYGGYTVEDIMGETREFVPAGYSVKSDIYTEEQLEYIEKYTESVFDIVYYACEKQEYKKLGEDFKLTPADYTSAEETVRAVMDIDSVVDMYLLYEFVHDYDCGEGSFFMCVDFSENSKHPKLEFTSPWDFNWAYNDSPARYWAAAFTEKSFVKSKGDRTNPWFVILGKQDWFRKLACEKWSALNKSGAVNAVISDERALIEKYRDDFDRKDGSAADCAYDLLDGWVAKRLKWMNKTFA